MRVSNYGIVKRRACGAAVLPAGFPTLVIKAWIPTPVRSDVEFADLQRASLKVARAGTCGCAIEFELGLTAGQQAGYPAAVIDRPCRCAFSHQLSSSQMATSTTFRPPSSVARSANGNNVIFR